MSWWWDNFWKPQQTKGKWCDFIFGFWPCSTAKNQNRPLEENELHSVDHPYRTYWNWFGIYRPQTQSWVCKTPTRHLPDTSQTPYRHPTDTPKYSTFWPIWGNWKKRNKLMKLSQIGCLSIASKSYPPRQTQANSDTSQTSSRHPTDTLKYGTFCRIQGN